jgi:hypothetical protein
MSVDTHTEHDTSLSERVDRLSPEELQATLGGMLTATTEEEASQQQLGYEEIAKLFLDAHNDRVDVLSDEKEQAMGQVLETMLEDPAASFLAEFQQLRLLYADRTVYAHLSNGAQIATFCTQHPETQEPDYTFKMRVAASGVPIYSVSKMVKTDGNTRRQLQFSSQYGALKISSPGYDAKGMGYTEYFDGEVADEQLAVLFHDIITGSARQLDRMENNPAEREKLDTLAKAHVQTEYQGIAQADGFQKDTIVLE